MAWSALGPALLALKRQGCTAGSPRDFAAFSPEPPLRPEDETAAAVAQWTAVARRRAAVDGAQ